MQISLDTIGKINGKKPVVVLLPDQKSKASDLLENLPLGNSVVLSSDLPDNNSLRDYSASLATELRKTEVKRATVVGIGRGGVLAQALALAEKKLARRIVLINSSCRLEPGSCTRAMDFIERSLPFGLPLRRISNDFDSRSFAHRIDCPSLIITSLDASSFERRQARFLSKALPNVWHIQCDSMLYDGGESLSSPLLTLIKEFTEVPTRRPQKNIEESEVVVDIAGR